MKTGIICIETEWEVLSPKKQRRNMDTNSMLRFLHEVWQIPYLYRSVATEGELMYYLKEFNKAEYKKKYGIIYFNFHGNPHTLHLEGDKKDISLIDLANLGGEVFADRLVHFSSCKTMRKGEDVVMEFKNITHAKLVSGYTESVDTMVSAIHDLSLFDTFLSYKQVPSIIKRMETVYGGLSKELGFVIY